MRRVQITNQKSAIENGLLAQSSRLAMIFKIQKGLAVHRQIVQKLYLIQIKRVSLK
jgi:hypothetical protein